MALMKWMGKETWEPLWGMEDLERQMSRLFGRTLLPGKEGFGIEAGFPTVDVVEEKDRVLVKADLPGMKEEDIHVEVEDGELTLRGERKKETETKEGKAHRVERTYGAFLRSFTLPANVDRTRVAASYKNGVLEVTLPKKEGAKPQEIKVEGKRK